MPLNMVSMAIYVTLEGKIPRTPWWSHRIWWRACIALLGPLMVLATFYLFWTDNWSTYMFYIGLALMFAVSIWDWLQPPVKVCRSSLSQGKINRR